MKKCLLRDLHGVIVRQYSYVTARKTKIKIIKCNNSIVYK